jgi:hypothetical protein
LHFAILEFWPFCMEIEKAAYLFYFRKTFHYFVLNFMDWVFKSAPR